MEKEVAVILLLFVALVVGEMTGRRRYIEMTHQIQERIVTYPGMPKFNFTNLHRGDGMGFWVEYNKFQLSEHAGTHIDAPIHFNQHGQYLHEVPLDNLVGPGVIIDISQRAERDRGAEVEVNDLIRWEQEHGEIPRGAFVIMKSGWYMKYPDTREIFGVDITRAQASEFRFPGISPAAARWLIDHRDIHGIGGDTPSPDKGGSADFMTHRIILGANKVILENVANLDQVPASGAVIYALPINLHRGSGGPVRMFATLNDGQIFDYSSGCGQRTVIGTIFASCLILLSSLIIQ